MHTFDAKFQSERWNGKRYSKLFPFIVKFPTYFFFISLRSFYFYAVVCTKNGKVICSTYINLRCSNLKTDVHKNTQIEWEKWKKWRERESAGKRKNERECGCKNDSFLSRLKTKSWALLNLFILPKAISRSSFINKIMRGTYTHIRFKETLDTYTDTDRGDTTERSRCIFPSTIEMAESFSAIFN